MVAKPSHHVCSRRHRPAAVLTPCRISLVRLRLRVEVLGLNRTVIRRSRPFGFDLAVTEGVIWSVQSFLTRRECAMDPISFTLGSGLRFRTPVRSKQVFIVHGHDELTKLHAKNYLQNTLHLPEPVILREQPSQGRTIIEKLEEYADRARIVFVLLTPDDPIVKPDAPEDQKKRARQNVIFEMGYFLGKLGRRNGRVLLLHKGEVELPSDVNGVVYIDISHGVEAAGETIRRELEDLL